MRRIFAGVATAAICTVALAGTAHAETSSTISDITINDGEMQFVLTLNDVPAGAEINERETTGSLQGTPLDLSVESLSDGDDVTQTTFLVMDTSQSMLDGGKLDSAKEAAEQFAGSVPEDVELGLVTFDDEARLLVEPTTDRQELLDTIDELTTARQTVLYDAVALTADELAGAGVGSALLLSDGADRGSQTTLDQATVAAKKSGARFDVVSFGESTEQISALTDIADASGGVLYTADDTEALLSAFDEAAASITNRYLLSAPIPEGFTDTSATLSATVFLDGAAITDQTFVTIDEAQLSLDPGSAEPKPAPALGPLALASDNLIWIALIGVGVAALIIVYVAISAVSDPERASRSGVKRRLSIYTLGGSDPVKEQETTVLGDTQVARSAVELAGRVVAKRDFESRLGSRLESAAVPLKPAEWLLIHSGITIGAGLLFFLLFSGRILLTAIGLFLGALIPHLYLSHKASQRKKAFLAALPDTLQLMAGSLAAGYSMPQAVDTVVREGKPPISTEFNRALVEARLGVDLEDALEGIADRMQSVDFTWVVMAIRIQREVGGNLAEVLETVSATLRERERLRRQVQVLSAEGRLSAWILALLPVAFALWMIIVRPGYLEPLVTTAFGWVLVGFGVFLMVVGGLWLRKVVKVEV